MNILLKEEGDYDKEIEIEEKNFDKFDLKYTTNLFQIESFMEMIPFLKLEKITQETFALVPQQQLS